MAGAQWSFLILPPSYFLANQIPSSGDCSFECYCSLPIFLGWPPWVATLGGPAPLHPSRKRSPGQRASPDGPQRPDAHLQRRRRPDGATAGRAGGADLGALAQQAEPNAGDLPSC